MLYPLLTALLKEASSENKTKIKLRFSKYPEPLQPIAPLAQWSKQHVCGLGHPDSIPERSKIFLYVQHSPVSPQPQYKFP